LVDSVPLRVRSGVALLKGAQLRGQASGILRVYHDGPHLAVTADAADCAFSTYRPEGSRLMPDLFVAAWTASSAPLKDRLLGAFERSGGRFIAEASSPVSPESDCVEDHPSATLLAACGSPGSAGNISGLR
jgi:hypothetical protein